jgi:Family of unknown function (DUF5694)
MRATIRLLSFFILITPILASAQPSPHQLRTGQNRSTITGPVEHYEGTAVGSDNEEFKVDIDLGESAGVLSGEIVSSYGTFAITGGTRNGDSITIRFDVNGDVGTVTGEFSGGRLVGTYSAGGQSGTVDVHRLSALGATTASLPATPLMFLGVYHMDNLDLGGTHTQADDVLTPKRQQEIEELVERLTHFRPTKIAIEAPYGDTYWPDAYRKYLAGQYKLGRNEIEQIAFRLAKRMNLPTLYGIDLPIVANGQSPTDKPNSTAQEAAQNQKTDTSLSPEDSLLRQSSVTAYLAHLNRAEEIRKGQEDYLKNLLPASDPDIYRRADLAADQYRRDLCLFSNINRIVKPGTDRVLVIIGARHLKLLKDLAADAPNFDLVDAESFLN